MHSPLTIYITLICTSTVLIFYLFFYVFRKRHNYSDIAHYFLLYTAAIGIYCFGAGMALTAVTLGEIKFWTVVQYVGLPVSSPLGLLFIMRYLGIHVTKAGFWSLLVVPAVSFMMVLTNDWHHLHYRLLEVDPVLEMPFVYQEIGLWYAVHGIYTFACMFVAFLLLLSRWKETTGAYRPQLAALLFGQLLPMLTAFLYLIGMTPPGVDPVPMVLWLSTLLYFWAISSSRLFAIMPIAKDLIFNHIKDGVIVLDESHRLIEFNQAAKSNFPELGKPMYGMDFSSIWLRLAGSRFPLKLEDSVVVQEVQIADGQLERVYQVSISSLNHIKNSKGLLLIFTDVTELKKLQAQLEHQAYYDELTQIHNRRAFLQQSEMDFAQARQAGSPFSVVLIDIDHFKAVNDTYGHDIGDRLLVHVVQACRSKLKEGQFFARYGGEEFALALNGYTAEQAMEISESLRKCVKTQSLEAEEGKVSVTLSMGVAEGTEETLHRLLKKADMALYSAKEAGRDRVQAYRESKEVAVENEKISTFLMPASHEGP